jgi:hypothetical protein
LDFSLSLNLELLLRLLQLRLPLVQDSAFYRAGRETSAAIDAGRVIDNWIFVTLVVGLFGPVNALYWAYR